jgi:hypothetical protein
MSRTQLVIAFVAFLAIYHAAGYVWGQDGKLYFVIGLLAVSCLLSLALFVLKRRLLDQDPDAGSASGDDPPEPEPDDDDIFPTPGPRLRGARRYVDGALGLCAAFCPPILVSVFRGDRLSWDGDFTGSHLLAMIAGVSLYYVVRPWVWRS